MARKTEIEAQEQKSPGGASGGPSDFIVTEDAPPFVAGRPVSAGQTIRLTAEESRFEAMAGHVIAAGTPSKQV